MVEYIHYTPVEKSLSTEKVDFPPALSYFHGMDKRVPGYTAAFG